MQRPHELVFGDETFNNACDRFSDQIDRLALKCPDQAWAVVSHGRVMAMYFWCITGDDPVAIWQSMKMPAYAVINLPDARLIDFVGGLQ